MDKEEIQRYIDQCRKLSNDGEYTWWSRLAELLEKLKELKNGQQK